MWTCKRSSPSTCAQDRGAAFLRRCSPARGPAEASAFAHGSAWPNMAGTWGLAFQITDDLLDIQGDALRLGKPVGSDALHDKATYPKLLGLAASQKLARESSDAAIASLSGLGEKAEPLRALARYMVERDS